MKYQGKKLDTKVYDVVITRVVSDKKSFKKYARKKNWSLFYKSAQIPVIILICSGLCALIYGMITNFKCGLFNYRNGFGTLLFIWDFDKIEYNSFLGIKVWKDWPPLLTEKVIVDGVEVIKEYGKPQFVAEAIPAYLAVFGFILGGLWYLYEVQALIARTLRIHKLSDSIFEKSLEGFNQNTMNMMAQNQAPQEQNQQVPPNNNINI